MKHRALAFALCLGLSAMAQAQVTVTQAWVRATVPAQKTTGAYMEIRSAENARLVGASSPAAKIVELHEMAMENNVMKMRAVKSLALPAGKPVQLKPGGYHFMMVDLAKPLKKGDVIPITLTIEGNDRKRQRVEVRAEVRDLAAPAASHGH